MTVRIVRLGTPRLPGEGVRIGTVRRPPRGVPKERHASDDWYDVWYPDCRQARRCSHGATGRDAGGWAAFEGHLPARDGRNAPSHALDLLAALSHRTDLSIGCYCAEETMPPVDPARASRRSRQKLA
jgi:uncharacterized protein YeaO (DUF488 family)